jgi:membrane-associated phospholipid phosphatase
VQPVSRRTSREPTEHALLAYPGRDVAVTFVLVTLTVVVFAGVALPGVLPQIQRLDDGWLELMLSSRVTVVSALATSLDTLGLVYVTLPIRVLLVAFLAMRRRWWHLAAFVTAVLMSEMLIGTMKALYDRPRPSGSLVSTTGASFPSGHSVAASVTVVAAVIALVPAGRRRAVWGATAMAFSLLMALSRAYLGAHWLSDALAGVLMGTSCALVAAVVVGTLQNRSSAQRSAAPEGAPDVERTPRALPGSGDE